MNTQRLFEIAKELNREDWCKRITDISSRTGDTTPIYIPLVGEFSSGKTTLINSLTDSKCLETATRPTTATIYKVFFGQEENKAEVIRTFGENFTEVRSLEDLKNETLQDSLVVNLYDTSRRVPQNIILIDTPGLSSPDTRHKQTLVDFLPQADAILLVTDINQQLTKSLTEFVKTISDSGRLIYLVVTKSDTKSAEIISDLRTEILKNGKISVEDVIFVSAQTDQLSELDKLFKKISNQKKEIIEKSNEHQLKNLSRDMFSYINSLQKESKSVENLNEIIDSESQELKKVQRYIKALEENVEFDLKGLNNETKQFFQKKVTQSLDRVLSSKSIDYNSAVNEVINIDSSIVFNQYKSKLQNLIRAKASETKLYEFGINLETLTNEDWDNLTIDSFSMDIDLNSVGHEYDKAIGWGTIIIGAVALAATGGVVAAGAAGAAGTVSRMATGMAALNTAVDVADTVSDIASIRSNRKLQKCLAFANKVHEKSQEINRQVGGSKGPLSGIVSAGTDKILAKPQRNKIIQEYLDSQLLPEFCLSLQNISDTIIRGVNSHIITASTSFICSKQDIIKKLLEESKENEEKNQLLKKQLSNYKSELTNFF